MSKPWSYASRSSVPDYTTLEGVTALKAKIEVALKQQQLPVPRFEIVHVAGVSYATSELMRPRYDLRSDMVNGLPPQARGRA